MAEPGPTDIPDRKTRLARCTGRLRQPFDWRTALLSAPGVPVTLVVGQLSGQTHGAVVAAGAAFTVGFGVARTTAHSRWYVTIVAAVGITLAAFVGTFAGISTWRAMALLAVTAGVCAFYVTRDQNVWWALLQTVGAMTIAVAFPGELDAAFRRALLVAGGSSIQILCGLLVAAVLSGLPLSGGTARKPFVLTKWDVASHMARSIGAVLVAAELARRLALSYGYWAPVTALLVLKPGRHDTDLRGLQRIVGTLIGILLADAFAFIVGSPGPFLTIATLGVTATLSYGLQNASYGVLSITVAATIVLMLSLIDHDVAANGNHRFVATLLGGTVALIFSWIVPSRPLWLR